MKFSIPGYGYRSALCASMIALSRSVSAADEASPEELRAKHLVRMKEVAGRFQIDSLRNGTQAAQLSDKPLLKYNDSTRKTDESTLWLWTERKLPCALMAIEYYPKRNGPPWLFEIVSLSDSKIKATSEPSLNWVAKQPALQRRQISGAPEPADSPIRRLIQAKQIYQRFTAYEKSVADGRIELRPLVNPLYRYDDEETKVIDGVVFAFVSGTNPEVALIVEAIKGEDGSPSSWRYSLAQMTGAAVFVEMDGSEVWTQGEADPPTSLPSYVNGWTNDVKSLPAPAK